MSPAQSKTYITGSNVGFSFPDGTVLFENLNFSFGSNTYGLLGPNGVGKTTFLKLLAKEIEPTSGSVVLKGSVGVLPQESFYRGNETVEKVLGNIEYKMRAALESLGMADFPLYRKMPTLSGGETVKVYLAKLLLNSPDVILLDEPTNNLDREGREILYQFIQTWKKCLIVVSHDRILLSKVKRILEFSNLGLQPYGGSYDFYLKQRQIEENAKLQDIVTARQNLDRQKRDLTKSLERQSRKTKNGERKAREGGIPKIVAGGLKRKAQVTLGRIKGQQESRVEGASQALREFRSKVKERNLIKVDLPECTVPQRKILLEVKDFNFRYPHSKKFLLSESVSFTLVGPERLAISGKNGAGKTTLVQSVVGLNQDQVDLSQGEQKGYIRLGTDRVQYLDQHVNCIDNDLTLLENFSIYTPHLSESERRIRLGRFLFDHRAVNQKVSSLSGGERMRAALACLFFSDNPPLLLVLDEPTNNLDIDSLQRIESALDCYAGAILVISHDESFLKNIRVNKEIRLESYV